MRIAFFIDVLLDDLDGVSITSHNIISRLPEEIEAIFLTAIPPEQKQIPYKVYTIRSINMPYQKKYQLALPKKKRIFKILDEFQPDLIHWSTPSFLGKCALKYSEQRGIPNVTIYHTHFPSYLDYFKLLPFKFLFSSFLKYQLLSSYSRSNMVFAPTLEMKNYLTGIGIAVDKVKIWGRGVDCDRFNPEKRQEDYFSKKGIPNGTKLLFVSRLVHYKETDTLIRLSHLLPENCQLIIVGDGPEEDKMKNESLSEKTFFLGRVHGEELAVLYASSDIFVFPSESETYGNVVNEAMASSLPVIAVSEGGPKNIVEHGVTGFLEKPKDENAILSRVNQLIDDEKFNEKISRNARNYAEKISWGELVNLLMKEYQMIANAKVLGRD